MMMHHLIIHKKLDSSHIKFDFFIMVVCFFIDFTYINILKTVFIIKCITDLHLFIGNLECKYIKYI